MDFMLDKQHEMVRTLFKEFAEKEVKPLAQEVDETEVFPRVTVEKMAKAWIEIIRAYPHGTTCPVAPRAGSVD